MDEITGVFTHLFNNYLESGTRYSAEDILNAREERVMFQQQLSKEWGLTLVCCRVNYPGLEKCNKYSVSILNVLSKEILNDLNGKIKYKTAQITAEGPIYILIIDESPLKVKRYAVELEESHPLGRFADIDVYDDAIGISREKLGLEQRKCYLCGEYAKFCVRSRKHGRQDIENFIKKSWLKFIR